MRVTLLGTGSPIPILERAGTALTVTVDDAPLLVDCGPRTVYELIRNGIDPGDVTELFFTHHHIDHNAAFHHLAIVGWSAGRESLTVYGPPQSEPLIESLYEVYEEDLAYRRQVGYPEDGIRNIGWVPVDPSFTLERGDLTVTTVPVEHSIETYAYRFETEAGCVVFSGDTRRCDRLAEFAAGADVLIHDAHMSPAGEAPTTGFVWGRYTHPYPDRAQSLLSQTHSTPGEAAQTAAAAGVDTLVLTHLPPYRDIEAMEAEAAAAFDGEVLVGEDGMTLTLPR